MEKTKTVRPTESPEDPDPVSRLKGVLSREGFSPVHEQEDWQAFGEEVYHRSEKVLFAKGETVILLIDCPELDDRILSQAVDGMTNLFRARSRRQKALSVFQTTTIYVCIIARSGTPHHASLSRFITTAGGAVLIPVVMVPDINQVSYPKVDKKVSAVRPRIDYFRYLLGERRETVSIHQQTIRTFWTSVVFVSVLGLFALISALL